MKRIAIDMDEVIADILPKFVQLYHKDYGLSLDLEINPGKEIYDHVPTEIKDKWFEYINEPGFFRDLAVIPDSQEVIKALQEKYEVYIVSAATEFKNSLIDKLDWLNEHFPNISWTNIIFCGHKIVNVDIMIDDRIKNFSNFKGRPLLFSSPHNLLIHNYERVNNWKEIAEKLL